MADTPQIQEIQKIISALETTGVIPDYVLPLDTAVLKSKPVLPPVDYTNLDFASIKLQLVNLLKANSNVFGFDIKDFSDANTTGMLLNLMAYMGQMLSYHTDSMVNELFLDTAQSSWAVSKLLNMFAYKPSRPQAGVILLSITRTKSTAVEPSQALAEDAAELSLSALSKRLKLTFGGEVFEVFPAKEIDGVLQPDILSDLIIPAYKNSTSISSPDINLYETLTNTYTCFALSGTTQTEVFRSTGDANQSVVLTNSPVNDSKIVVKVDNDIWGEVTHLSLASLPNTTVVKSAIDNKTPFLIATLSCSPEFVTYVNSLHLLDLTGMVVAINYNNTVELPDYLKISRLHVPYNIGIVSGTIDALTNTVQVLLYHSNYIWGQDPTAVVATGLAPVTIKSAYSSQDILWESGDILYLAKNDVFTLQDNSVITQPIIISETQLIYARSEYTDLIYLRDHPESRIAVGRALSPTTMAFGISADISTIKNADPVYEVVWDGNFKAQIKFGNDVFGKIPPKDSLLTVVYRTNDLVNTGTLIKSGETNRTLRLNNIDLIINNKYASAPSSFGESPDTSKQLVTRFFATQERAISGQDYIVLSKRFNSNIKLTAQLSQSDGDNNIIKLYGLMRRKSASLDTIDTLSLLEKYELRNFLLQYAPLGVSLEFSDGIIRTLDIRIDLQIKSGYVSGQVKSDLAKIIYQYFNLDNLEMGIGFNAAELIKTISVNVSGIKNMNIYFGGTIKNPDGSISNVKEYQFIKDIPSYLEETATFPSISTTDNVLNNITDKLKAYEMILLDSLTINIAG